MQTGAQNTKPNIFLGRLQCHSVHCKPSRAHCKKQAVSFFGRLHSEPFRKGVRSCSRKRYLFTTRPWADEGFELGACLTGLSKAALSAK